MMSLSLSLSLSLFLVPRTGAKNLVYRDQRVIILGSALSCVHLHTARHECGDADEAGDDDDAVVVVSSTSRT